MDRFREIYKVSVEFIALNPTFVASNDGMVVGFYALVPDGTAATLEFLYVEPSYIGKGFGRILWNHMTNYCRKNNIKVVHLVCGPEPVEFYLNMGAVPVGEEDSRVIEGRKILKLLFRIR
jgi:GNAT superfamily N-acetyltransferase